MTDAIKTVCAWCLLWIHGRDDAPRVSHGACVWCLIELLPAPADPWSAWVDVGGEG